MMMEEFMSPEMLAKHFHVSIRTVIRLIERGDIRAVKVGRQWRIHRDWIQEWMSGNMNQTSQDIG